MSERNVMAAFLGELKRTTPEAWLRKIHGGQFMAGLPDYVVAWEGRTCWVETKDAGKTLSPLQVAEFSRQARAGSVIFVGDDGLALAVAVAEYLRGMNDAPMRWPLREVRKKEPGRRRAEKW